MPKTCSRCHHLEKEATLIDGNKYQVCQLKKWNINAELATQQAVCMED